MLFLIEVTGKRWRWWPAWAPFGRSTRCYDRNYSGARARARKDAQLTAHELVRAGAFQARVFEMFAEVK